MALQNLKKLDNFKYNCFITAVSNNNNKKKKPVDLAKLPPTKNAATNHLVCYHRCNTKYSNG